MLLQFNTFAELNTKKLMQIYIESNTENAAYFYPDETDTQKAVQLCEKGFTEFLKDEFFAQSGGTYWVLEEDGQWVSALRTSFIKENLYYIEALETKPDCRKQGYAVKLLQMVAEALKANGSLVLCDCVDKRNIASLNTHLKAGFSIASDAGFDYLQEKYDDQEYGMSYRFPANEI